MFINPVTKPEILDTIANLKILKLMITPNYHFLVIKKIDRFSWMISPEAGEVLTVQDKGEVVRITMWICLYFFIGCNKFDLIWFCLQNSWWTCFSFLQDSQENVDGWTVVYPTFGVGNEVSYFERTYVCKCTNVLQASVIVIVMYYVFDVQYPSEHANTCNFLDSCVGWLWP